MNGQILLIGDDTRVLEHAGQVLGAEGYGLSRFGLGPAALRHLDECRTALVVLAGAPVERSWTFCRRLLASSGVPLLLLIVGGDEVDRVQGLELGADDCAGWPLPDAELVMRVHALLRTASQPGAARRAPGYFADGDLVVDLTRPEVWRDGEPVAVSATELRVLACFVRHMGQVVSPECLAAEVWAPVRAGTGHSVSPYIHSLRAKLEADPAHPRRILTRRGQGYLFVPLADGG
jgi:DNA-binding response OmpR family regulator